MKIKIGDKIKFGVGYCDKMGRNDLLNKTVMMTPQEFEYDNGLYDETQECPGMFNEIEEEPESIYHLFGNHLEWFYDCQLIDATEEDLKEIEKIREDRRAKFQAEAEAYAKWVNESQKIC